MIEEVSFKSAEKQRKVASLFILLSVGLPFLALVLDPVKSVELALTGLVILVTLLAAVFFLAWFFISYGNLTPLKGSPKHSQSFVCWIWFIPVASLWMPISAMNELWYSADQSAGTANGKIPPILWTWWLCWILSPLLRQLAKLLGEINGSSGNGPFITLVGISITSSL